MNNNWLCILHKLNTLKKRHFCAWKETFFCSNFGLNVVKYEYKNFWGAKRRIGAFARFLHAVNIILRITAKKTTFISQKVKKGKTTLMKKILSVFLVLAMMLSLVVVTTVAPSAEPVTSGTKLTGENLMSLTAGEYYMDEDIDFLDFDLSELSAMTLPGGTVIHGNGHSIKGLNSTTFTPFTVNGTVTINDLQIGGTDGAKVFDGLFTLGEGATLNLNNVDINIKSTNVVAGKGLALQAGIAAKVPEGVTVKATGCTVSGTIGNTLASNAADGTNYDVATNNIGGFFAIVEGTVTIDNCTSTATLKNKDQDIGAFIGNVNKGTTIIRNSVSNSDATITGGKRAGGFVGLNNDNGNLTIEGCINYSNLETTNQWVGGIVGISRGPMTIDGCLNFGTLTTEKSVDAFGGILGKADSDDTIKILDCVNYGNVTAYKNAGAIIGHAAWAVQLHVSGCKNYGTITAKNNTAGMACAYLNGNASASYLIENCVNFGTITSVGNTGFIGEWSHDNAVKSLTVKYCLNVGDITGGSNTAAFLGYDGSKQTGNFGASLIACSTIGTLTVESWIQGGIICNRTASHELINCYNYGKMKVKADQTFTGVIYAHTEQTLAETSTGNKYLYDPEGTTTFHTTGGTKAASVDEAVADLNALYNDTLGLSFKNVDGAIEVVTQPKFVGTQTSATGAKVRLLGTIGGDLADYAKVGFKVDSKYDVTVKTYAPSEATYAYYHIQAAGKMETAASYDGSYFYTLTFTGVPQTGTVEFTVQAYAEYTNGLNYTGARYTVTVVDGLVTSTTLAD